MTIGWPCYLKQNLLITTHRMHRPVSVRSLPTTAFIPSLEIPRDSVNPSVEERAKSLGQVQQDFMAELKLTQEWQKKQADC